MRLPNFQRGFQGEGQAAAWLTDRGYRILTCNLVVGRWEVDILAFDPKSDEIVVVEVKSRRSDIFGHPATVVTPLKLKALFRVAQTYCQRHHLAKDLRFDIISVLPAKIEHFKNVSW